MKITDFKKEYKTNISKNINKVIVRELDEESKNFFVAFVDVGEKTYDVNVELSKTTIENSTCDCENGHLRCIHQIMTIHYVLEKQKPKTVEKKIKVVKKKVSVAEELLDEIEIEDLRSWIKIVFEKNKHLELEFVNSFKKENENITEEDVVSRLKEASKVVVKNRKTIETNELKKIVELWNNVGEIIVKQITNNITEPQSFKLFIALNDYCLTYGYQIQTNSNKIIKFVEQVAIKFIEPINNIVLNDTWEKVIDYLIEISDIDHHHNSKVILLNQIFNLLPISSETRKASILNKLFLKTNECIKSSRFNNDDFIKSLFQLYVNNNVFEKYQRIFIPIKYENNYNIALINEHLKLGNLKIAETFSLKQVEGNFNNEYSVPYWNILSIIYKIQDRKEEYLRTQKQLLLYKFDLEAFKEVYDFLEKQERTKWKTSLLNKAKNSFGWSRNNFEAINFYYGIYAHEGKFDKIIDSYDIHQLPEILLFYFDSLYNKNKLKLLNLIINKMHTEWKLNFEINTEEHKKIVFDGLYNKTINNYKEQDIRLVFYQMLNDKYRRYAITPYLEKIAFFLNFDLKQSS